MFYFWDYTHTCWSVSSVRPNNETCNIYSIWGQFWWTLFVWFIWSWVFLTLTRKFVREPLTVSWVVTFVPGGTCFVPPLVWYSHVLTSLETNPGKYMSIYWRTLCAEGGSIMNHCWCLLSPDLNCTNVNLLIMEYAFFLKSSSLSFCFWKSDKVCYEVAGNSIKYLYLRKCNTNIRTDYISTVLSGGRGKEFPAVLIVHGKT